MNTDAPRISIVLPTYNGSKFIAESIESILAQTEGDFELIIVNDCSTDNTLELVRGYESKDERIKVISNETNLKLPASLNVGFAAAKGRFLTWTSDDNKFKPDALKFMADYLDDHKETGMVCCTMDYIDEEGRVVRKSKFNKRNAHAQFLIVSSNVGACFMYTRETREKVGDYNTNFFCAEDYEYWLRIGLVQRIDYINNNLYQYRKNSGSLTANKARTVTEKTLELRRLYWDAYVEKFKLSWFVRSHVYYRFWRYDREHTKVSTIVKACLMNPNIALKLVFHSINASSRAKNKRKRLDSSKG